MDKRSQTSAENGKKGGRPKGSTSKPAFHKFISIEQMENVVASMYAEATSGKVEAAKWLGDQYFGKAKQAITGGDDDDNPLKIIEIIKSHNESNN